MTKAGNFFGRAIDNRRMKRLIATFVLLGGCAAPKTAIVDGREVPRQTLEFSGQPYTVKHEGAHPRPGGPSGGLKDAGGSIRGRVCGMLVDFDVMHKGDHVQLVGSIDNHMPAAIDVSEQQGARHFTGNLGTLGVDFLLVPGEMQGHVGIRVFAVESQGDAYNGFMRVPGLLDVNNNKQRVGLVINGRDALLAMPAADQAAVLPALLTCGGSQFRGEQQQVGYVLTVGVGGQATDLPPETSAVYTRGR
jgi:hypothetical protein